ncbi:MAG: ABC transporter permease, partial [Gemmatimonadetes bacterium]|nr:ABC transporter permease [Gemmatimonadota bacterium]NIR77113.1 ABC transporter permease [Gemmatimonadota bacterium]NIT85631.1 ABC transporter permease [Gemmatimonadota bacterium]NIU29463.1 ABC transporter permease [Gemmatimonadota bacterium]NIU34526.1 ABC transporter permease [Gemmatimonadota bacterium]
GADLITSVLPQDLPRIDAVSVDGAVLLFALSASLGTGLFFGAVPALSTLRQGLPEAVKGGGRTTAGSRRQHRVSQALVVAQVSLTLVLLVGAGLTVRSFLSLTDQDPGFRAEEVVAVSLHVSPDRYRTVPQLERFYRRLRERVAAVPGVESVAVGNYLPIEQGRATRTYRLEGSGETEPRQAQYGVVSPDYFRTLGIPVTRGRSFRESDRRDDPRVAVVNAAMARRTWQGRDPVGRRIRFEDEEEWMTVVGVVGDVRGSGPARDPRPGFYVSYQQRPDDPVELAVGRNAVLLLRTRAGIDAVAGPLRRAIWEVEPRQPVPEIASLERIVSRAVGPERFRAVLLGCFAGIALLLVVSGVYGVVAHLVSERTHEFGIRVAMGATGREILGRVLRWGLRLAGLGLAIGLAGVLLGARYLASLLFGVEATDTATIGGAVATVLTVTLAACLLPARRATRVDPVDTLRPDPRAPGGGGG